MSSIFQRFHRQGCSITNAGWDVYFESMLVWQVRGISAMAGLRSDVECYSYLIYARRWGCQRAQSKQTQGTSKAWYTDRNRVVRNLCLIREYWRWGQKIVDISSNPIIARHFGRGLSGAYEIKVTTRTSVAGAALV